MAIRSGHSLRLGSRLGYLGTRQAGTPKSISNAVRQGGYLRHARTRHRASVRGYTRRRFRCRFMPPQWRHLRFTIQRRWSPKEDGRYVSTSFRDSSIPPRGVFCASYRMRMVNFVYSREYDKPTSTSPTPRLMILRRFHCGLKSLRSMVNVRETRPVPSSGHSSTSPVAVSERNHFPQS